MIMKYFAYGLNLDSNDLMDWCKRRNEKTPNFSHPTIAILENYKLDFTKYSPSRGGGVADIIPSKNDVVYGVVFDVPDTDLRILDKKEGAPDFYKRCTVKVRFLSGDDLEVLTYEVVTKDGFVLPTNDYVDIIIRGAKKHNLPSIWIDKLRSFKV